MSCDISYIDACEMLHTYNDSEDDTGEILEHSYLFQFDESVLTEAERLNVILPLIKWEVDNNELTELQTTIFIMKIYSRDALRAYWTRRMPHLL